jgi:hypothetical protein
MPDRVIRDEWLESEAMNSLSWPAESFFLRLCLKADDYGRFHGDLRLLEAQLFPVKAAALTRDIESWLHECEQAGLVHHYSVNGQPCLYIPKFRQRRRQKTPSKFPDPPSPFESDPGGPSYTAHYPNIARTVGGASCTPAGQSFGEGCSPHSPPPGGRLSSVARSAKEGLSSVARNAKEDLSSIFPPPSEPEEQEPLPVDRPSLNRALLGEAFAYFLRLKAPPCSLDEIKSCWICFERTSTGRFWSSDATIVDDWRVAMARRMSDLRTKTATPDASRITHPVPCQTSDTQMSDTCPTFPRPANHA